MGKTAATPRQDKTDPARGMRPGRAVRHAPLDVVALRKRRAKNKAAARSRRINRKRGAR